MAKIVGYIGCSLDGFIADKNDRLDWLNAYDAADYGDYDYTKFIKTIGTVVMGRGTYDWLRNEVEAWPYPDLETLVVTSKPLSDLPKKVHVWADGIDALVTHLRSIKGKNIWICGGGKLQSAIVERDALDFLEIYMVPTLIGDGIRLWPGGKTQTTLDLDDVRHLDKGIVRLAYRRRELGVT